MLGLGLVLFSALVDMFWTRSPMFDRLQRCNNSHCLPKPLPGGKGDTPSTHLPIDVSTSAPSIWFLDYKRPPLRISGSSLIAYKTATNSRQGPDEVPNPKWSQPTLNQFPSAPEGSKQDMYRFSAIQAHTVFPSAIRQWNTLPVDICHLSPDSFKTRLNSLRFI